MLQWIDGVILYAKDESELVDIIELFFRVCSEICLNVISEKATLFARDLQFLDRKISCKGIQHHPRHFESMVALKNHHGKRAKHFICTTNWMRSSMTAFLQRVTPFQELEEECYKK